MRVDCKKDIVVRFIVGLYVVVFYLSFCFIQNFFLIFAD